MQWNEEQQAAFNGWFGAPQKAWENWWDLVAGSTQNGHAPAAPPPAFDFWQGLTEQWRATMQQSLNAFSPDLAESARTAMDQFLMGQGHAEQLMKMASDAWQAIQRNSASPADWQQALNSYMAQQRQGMANAADVTKAFQQSSELWQLYTAEMQKFAQPWLSTWMQWPQQMGTMAQPNAAGAEANANPFLTPLLTMGNLYWDTYHQTLGRMVNMPSLGLMREFNEKVNRGFTLWQENQRANQAYQLLLGEGLLQAFAAFMQRLLTLAQAGESVDSQRKLLALWVEVADEQFLKLFHSERYANAQSQYVNSSMALRSQQRELMEILLRMNDLPTRSDLDEAHHNIYLLRQEVKALKKVVNELVEKSATPVVPVAAMPAQAEATPAKAVAPKAVATKSKRSTKAAQTLAAQTADAQPASSDGKKSAKRSRPKTTQAGEGA